MKIKNFILALFTSTLLQANLYDPDVQVATEGDPSATLCESVNLLSGDFVASSLDHIIQGAEPLELRRHYVSGDGKGELAGWEFFPHLKLEMLTKDGKRPLWKHCRRAKVCEPNGTQLIFKRLKKVDPNLEWVEYLIDFEKHGKGITNTSRGKISGRTNLRNHKLVRESSYRVLLYCADGTTRCYRRVSEDIESPFSLRWEHLPNGNKIQYRYKKDGRLKQVFTTNPKNTKIYTWCRFHYKGKHDVEIETSDGKRLIYTYTKKGKKKNRQYLLTKIVSPTNPEEKIEYEKWSRAVARTFPDNRKVAVEYYDWGTEDIADPKYYRVKTLLKSSDVTGKMTPSHHFDYDLEKRITHVYDAEKNQTSIEYNENYQPCRTIFYDKETPHHIIEQKWGAYGQLEEKIQLDGNGNPLITQKYTYDERGNPIKVELIGTICSKDSQDISVETYAYDSENRPIESISQTGLITRTTYIPKTNLVEKKITTDEKAIFLQETYKYNDDNILIETVIDDGEETHITRIKPKTCAPAENLPEIIEEYALDQSQEVLLTKTKLTYNHAAQVIKKEIYDANGTLAKEETFDYDAQGRLIEENRPLGQKTTYAYDRNGNVIKEIKNEELEINRRFDCANRLIVETQKTDIQTRTTKIEYNKTWKKASETNPFGGETHYVYTPLGQIREVKHPNGSTESYTYDTLGHVSTYTNPLGYTTTYISNIHGKPLEIHHPDRTKEVYTYYPDGALHTYTNQAGVTIEYTYDALGRETSINHLDTQTSETFTYSSFHLLSTQDRDSVTTIYTYDFAGRKISETRADRTIILEYDPLGRVHKTHQNDLLTTIHTYNALDQLIEEQIANQITQYTYDLNGNQTSIIHPNGTETFDYDPFNRLTLYTDPLGNQTKTTYDEKETLTTTRTDSAGNQTVEQFDNMMHLIKKEIFTQEGILIFSEEYKRDLLGKTILQKCHVYDEGNYMRTLLIEKTYDEMGRLKTVLEGENTPEKRFTQFVYTPTGNLLRVVKPDGTRVNYSYNSLDQLTRLTSSDGTIDYSYTYTPSGNLLTSTDHIHNLTTTRTLDLDGNILSETLANGLTLKSAYDPLGRRTTLTLPTTTVTYTYGPLHLETVTALDQTATYTYDPSGNLVELDTGIPISYTYDALNRPTNLTSPPYSQALTYDQVGNVITFEDNESYYDLRYDRLNQLIEEKNHTYGYDSYHNRLHKDNTPYTTNTIHALTSAGDTTYTYDACGNPLTKTTPFGTTQYTYDALGRLTSVTTPKTHVTYIYDSEHRRIAKTTPTETIHYLYDGQDEIGAFTSDHELLELRILGDKSQAERQTLYMVLYNQLYLPLADLQGNIVRMISSTEAYTFQYNAFGEEYPADHLNPWRYASKRYDPETGLIYFGRRYYDSVTGRFLTPDPSPLTDSLNLYAYACNNPLIHTDLYGLFSLLSSSEMLAFRPPPDPQNVPYNDFEEIAGDWGFGMQNIPSEDFSHAHPSQPIFSEQSSNYDLGRPEYSERMLGFTNGIRNSFDNAKATAGYLSRLSEGYNVHYTHSATMGMSLDLIHAGLLFGYKKTKSVVELHNKWDGFFKNTSSTGTILETSHSRGVIVTRNALLMYDEEKRKRIYVVALAPAAYINPELCGGVKHYVSERDFVHRLDFFNRRKYAHTIYRLKSRSKSPWDHTILSPTFEETIRSNINFFLKHGCLNED